MPPFPEPVQHEMSLPDGRALSYYTFECGGESKHVYSTHTHTKSSQESAAKHPVLYLHGFPGSGVEGAICASEVASAGCELYSPDRPGYGYSDPYPAPAGCDDDNDSNNSGISSLSTGNFCCGKCDGGGCPDLFSSEEDRRVQTFVSDLWDLVRNRGWTSFSIIAYSGGGLYALAMLSSYLDGDRSRRPLGTKDLLTGGGTSRPPLAKLEAVSIVSGVCCPAGTGNMMPAMRRVHALVSNHRSSRLSRGMLRALISTTRTLLRSLPTRASLKVVEVFALNQFPPEDTDTIRRNKELTRNVLNSLRNALRQGIAACELEAEVEFRNAHGFEGILKEQCREALAVQDDDDAKRQGVISMPRVSLFQGKLDLHVPPSHSRYVHHELLCGRSILNEYDGLAHFSLIVEGKRDYVDSIVPHSLQDGVK